jgi:hypothetical protein
METIQHRITTCEFGKTQVLKKLFTILAGMELHDTIRTAARVSFGFELPEWPDVGNSNCGRTKRRGTRNPKD